MSTSTPGPIRTQMLSIAKPPEPDPAGSGSRFGLESSTPTHTPTRVRLGAFWCLAVRRFRIQEAGFEIGLDGFESRLPLHSKAKRSVRLIEAGARGVSIRRERDVVATPAALAAVGDVADHGEADGGDEDQQDEVRDLPRRDGARAHQHGARSRALIEGMRRRIRPSTSRDSARWSCPESPDCSPSP